MTWYSHTWCAAYAAPAAACTAIAWLCLLRRFAGRGRLLGTWRSACLSALVLLAMGATSVGAGLLLPHLGQVPPAAAGVATGFAVAPRGRRQDEGAQPLLRFMTLGIGWLLERLEYRLATDAQTWCDSFMERFKEVRQLRIFIHGLKRFLLDRPHSTVTNKAVCACHEDAERRLDAALDVQTRVEEACRTPAPPGVAEFRRARSADEEARCVIAFNEARAMCAHLLRFAYCQGRRSERPEIERLRDAVVPPDAYRSTGALRQGR
ncbi:hypothetical protein RVR_1578 [Actinacidiphila reveromycinica]|uniref:Uncharacterized protein n=1 Tax=Actinacidiphila reveromycinica TaxID=659352 RepID=A0A7U3ULP8_9ACTN|nr:hypothetical protein [Streptomyces sp. SN-593]BBA96330.1 hypothetical protein RVR_1578 [Streptomyces sp. SN-593]